MGSIGRETDVAPRDSIEAGKGLGDTMKNFGRITLLLGLVVLGNAASVHAQPRDRFHRVTTTAGRDVRSPSPRDVRFPSNGNRLAATARGSAVSSSSSQADVLRPYTARAQAEAQNRESDAGRNSSWRDEPLPIAPTPRAASPARSHTYFPGLRSGVARQQPLTLTTRQTMVPRSCCSPSRSQAMAGTGHQAVASMGHHR